MHHVQRVKVVWRHGNGTEDVSTALLRVSNTTGPGGQVDLGRRQKQGLGVSATGCVQDVAEGAHGPPGRSGSLLKRISFLQSEEQSVALGIKKFFSASAHVFSIQA